MGTYIKKAMPGISYESLFIDCVVFLDEPHKAGDIIEDRIILTDNVWHGENIPTEEELDSVVYDKGYAVRAIKINFIDDIETS